jgi:hypothetical protein
MLRLTFGASRNLDYILSMPITLDDRLRNTEQKNYEKNESDEVGDHAAEGRPYCAHG